MPPPPIEPTRTALRDFILKRFSREEFFIFASDHFSDFHEDNAGRDLTNTALANAFLLHCERNEAMARLHACLQTARPDLYAAAFSQIEVAAVPVKQRDPRQVFLSHSHHDAALVRRLANHLRTAGLRVWMTPDDILGSESWQAAIERGLSESGLFVVVLTPNAVASKWVKKETLHAMQYDDVFKFVPVYAQACDPKQLSLFLPQTQYVNFERDYDAGFAALCQALGVTPNSSNGSERLKRSEPSSPAPPTPPYSSTWRALQQKVDAALANKQWAEAMRLIETWHALDPDDADAAAAQTRLRELRRADEAAARAAQLTESRQKLDEALAEENWAEAARHAAIWRQLEPGQARAERALALAQNKLKAQQTQKARLLTLASGITLELVRIEAGDFLYGENKQTLSLNEFWMGKTAVTVAQYSAFLQATKHPRKGYWQ